MISQGTSRPSTISILLKTKTPDQYSSCFNRYETLDVIPKEWKAGSEETRAFSIEDAKDQTQITEKYMEFLVNFDEVQVCSMWVNLQ